MDDRITPERRRKLDALVLVRREWTAAANARLAALVRAQALVTAGVLTVVQVCNVLEITERTWYRWASDYGLRELAAAVVAEMAEALDSAGATQETTVEDVRNDPNLELALLSIGARFRPEE